MTQMQIVSKSEKGKQAEHRKAIVGLYTHMCVFQRMGKGVTNI